jgi:hypothetical protein
MYQLCFFMLLMINFFLTKTFRCKLICKKMDSLTNYLIFNFHLIFKVLCLIFSRESFERLAKDPETKVAILTGADPYYCAGKSCLSLSLGVNHPVTYVKNL